MRKIPLEVFNFANSLRPMAHFLLTSEDPKIFAPINAIVDTGSPITLIGPTDLSRMRLSSIQIKKLIGKNRPINIGGEQISARTLEKANLKFGEHLKIEMPVNFPINIDNKSTQPSLLGVDFMLNTGAKLVFNPSKKEAYFEIEED